MRVLLLVIIGFGLATGCSVANCNTCYPSDTADCKYCNPGWKPYNKNCVAYSSAFTSPTIESINKIGNLMVMESPTLFNDLQAGFDPGNNPGKFRMDTVRPCFADILSPYAVRTHRISLLMLPSRLR